LPEEIRLPSPSSVPDVPAATGDSDSGPGGPRWSTGAIWVAVVLLAFLWGSTVLGIAFRSAEMDVSAWWLVLLVGSVPIVVLLIVTSRLLRRRSPDTRSAGPPATHRPASVADQPSAVQPRVGGDITDREQEVLALLSSGRTHSEIANELFWHPAR
jgi:hypothetical protein